MATLVQSVPNISGRRKGAESLYLAGFKSDKVSLYALSTGQAQQRATEHFKPKKKDKDQLWVRSLEGS